MMTRRFWKLAAASAAAVVVLTEPAGAEPPNDVDGHHHIVQGVYIYKDTWKAEGGFATDEAIACFGENLTGSWRVRDEFHYQWAVPQLYLEWSSGEQEWYDPNAIGVTTGERYTHSGFTSDYLLWDGLNATIVELSQGVTITRASDGRTYVMSTEWINGGAVHTHSCN